MRLTNTISLYILIILYLKCVKCARILGIFQFPSYSHQIVFQQIWAELSLRGHEVVVVTPNPLNNPKLKNLTEIDVGYIKNLITSKEELQESMAKDLSTVEMIKAFYSTSLIFQEAILKDQRFVKIYNSSQKFDLVMIEALHPGMYSLAGKFNCPFVAISSLGVIIPVHGSVGNTNHPVLYPDMNVPTHFDMSLKEKISSIYTSIALNYFYNYQAVPEADAISRKYLGMNVPYLGDLVNNVSFLLINTNHIIHNVRPTVPKVIQIGQLHIRLPRKLPQDLQKILDNANNGVIYFSLGSNVKSININKKLRATIIEAMAELPYTILWKWESDDLENIPKNVIARKWFPQQDVLAHSNIKAFVTQGGLQSIEEAISRQVPMVGIPFIGDQPMNVNKLNRSGLAVALDPANLNKNQLKKAIVEVVTNPNYRENVKKAKLEMEDQPESGLERAVWWIEYAIRHKGAPYLRSATADIPWWQFFFLDLIASACLVLYLFAKFVYVLTKFISYVPKEKFE